MGKRPLYRVITNGHKFRVQIRYCYFWWCDLGAYKFLTFVPAEYVTEEEAKADAEQYLANKAADRWRPV